MSWGDYFAVLAQYAISSVVALFVLRGVGFVVTSTVRDHMFNREALDAAVDQQSLMELAWHGKRAD